MGLSGQVPKRVDAATKSALLALIDGALEAARRCVRPAGCSSRRSVARTGGTVAGRGRLADAKPGGVPLHGLLEQEVEAILAVFEDWPRWTGRTASWPTAAPTWPVLVLALNGAARTALAGQALPCPVSPGDVGQVAVPGWRSWSRTRSGSTTARTSPPADDRADHRGPGLAQMLTHLVSVEETHTQVQNAFTAALESEGLLEAAMERPGRRWTPTPTTAVPDPAGRQRQRSQMISKDTRTFMTLLAIAQHFGRPSTPTDQAWIESLNGTIKIEWPHLLAITDPAILRAELDLIQEHYNTVRLHQGIATSPRTTNTKAAARRSAKPAATGCTEPGNNALPGPPQPDTQPAPPDRLPTVNRYHPHRVGLGPGHRLEPPPVPTAVPAAGELPRRRTGRGAPAMTRRPRRVEELRQSTKPVTIDRHHVHPPHTSHTTHQAGPRLRLQWPQVPNGHHHDARPGDEGD